MVKQKDCASLEDWVVENFGRTPFVQHLFQGVQREVWGIACNRISAEWVDRRINGLSLAKALKKCVLQGKRQGRSPTLVDKFLYPGLGIGRISDRLKEEIELFNAVLLDTRVEAIHHADGNIDEIVVSSHGRTTVLKGNQFISTLPLTHIIRMLEPAPPQHIVDAASRLKFRILWL